jgi:predicted nucleotidyltransferase
MTLHAREYWKQRFAADREQLEQTRQAGLAQATKAAAAMRERWPQIRAVHLFGSVLDDRFRSHSDLDLLVDGLPPGSLLDAIAIAEDAGPLPVDLKRREDLSDDLVQRLLRKSRTV